MASVAPQLDQEPLTLTITPGALIEQTEAGSTSQIFTNNSFTVSPGGLNTQNEPDGCSAGTRDDVAQGFAERPVKQEAVSQTWFENAVKRELNIPSGYEKVAVLVIRWDDDLDDPRFKLGHDAEIKRLKDVFGNRFHFDVSSEVRLNSIKKPQNILNKAITDHIATFDGPNNLLIIYYTGHGHLVHVPGGMEYLQLAATTSRDKASTAIWHQAEKPLIQSAEADVLSLLDCCYAGSAHKGDGGERRTYELLAACHKGQKTRGPGPNSFTTRLLNALELLLDDPRGPPIIMTRLESIINNRDTQGLIPVTLLDQLDSHVGRHVQLAPVQERAREENEQFQRRPQEKSVVKLRFSLEEDELTQSQIENWAHELSKLGQVAKIPIRRIDWMKVENRKMTQRWKDALDFAQTRKKKRKSIPSEYPSDYTPSPTKRRTKEDLSLPEEATDHGPLTPASST